MYEIGANCNMQKHMLKEKHISLQCDQKTIYVETGARCKTYKNKTISYGRPSLAIHLWRHYVCFIITHLWRHGVEC